MSKIIQPGEKGLYKGEIVVITGTKKDFITNQVYYKLEDGEFVSASEISPAEGKEAADLKSVSDKYTELTGKEVPTNKRKDVAWIKSKIEEIDLSK